MPFIAETAEYDGVVARIDRLGVATLIEEVKDVLTGFKLLVEEKTDANGGKAIREMIDSRFKERGGWAKRQTGDIDWEKCRTINGTRICVGVEIQVSGRSDSGLFADIAHLRRAFALGRIDVGIIVVPSGRLGNSLTDRAPKMADAKRHVEEARAHDLPILVLAIEHDGPGPPLAKQFKASQKKQK